MESYKVTLIKRKIIESGIEYTSAYFNEDLLKFYGKKFFITVDAEVAVIDLIEGEQAGTLNDISEMIKYAWDIVELNTKSTMLSAIQKYAWRFFSDLSPNGNIWYSGNIFDEILYKQVESGEQLTEIVEKNDMLIEPVLITYHKWNSLDELRKRSYAKSFVLNPVEGNKQILNSDFHGKL